MKSFKAQTIQKAGIQFPHVHLCFDDHAVQAWYSLRGYLMKHKAKVTYYVDSFDRLNDEEIDCLRLLRADGHVIGCHGLNHVDAREFSRKYGIEEYIDQEILPAMEAMAANGFTPTHFAFPHSHYDESLFEAVSKYFCYVRPGNETHSYTPSRTVYDPSRATMDELTVEHKIRTGNASGAVRWATERLLDGQGINIVFHDVRRPMHPKSPGSHASENSYIMGEEFDAFLTAIETKVPNLQYQTYAGVCEEPG